MFIKLVLGDHIAQHKSKQEKLQLHGYLQIRMDPVEFCYKKQAGNTASWQMITIMV